MEEPKIIKAECLVTYNCPLECKTCKVYKMGERFPEPEFDLEKWKKAFKIIYKDLNSDFICIYGAEPLTLGLKNLGDIVLELNKYAKDGKSYSVISNGLLLNTKAIDYLVSKRLDSISCSIDTIDGGTYDISSKVKSSKGLKALDKFKKKGVRDTCGIITVNRKNIHNVPRIARQLIERGHYVNIDLIHYDKQNGNDTFSASKEELEDIIFKEEDIPILSKIADELIKIKKESNMIFPSVEYFELWKDKNYSIELGWKCGSEPQPHSITLRPDFHIQNCDCYAGEDVGKYTIFDLPKKWDEFSINYFDDATDCPGCFWSTHFMATEIMKNYDRRKIDQYQHRE